MKSISVLDRTKEPGALGEPLYQDIVTVLAENAASLPFAAHAYCGMADVTAFLPRNSHRPWSRRL